MAPTPTIRRWIYGVLAADTTLTGLIGTRIYHGKAPRSAVYPFVTMQQQGGLGDLKEVGQEIIWTDVLMQIKAVDTGDSTSRIEPIADRVHALLHKASGSASGGTIWTCTREDVIDLPDESGDVPFQQLIQLYRVLMSTT